MNSLIFYIGHLVHIIILFLIFWFRPNKLYRQSTRSTSCSPGTSKFPNTHVFPSICKSNQSPKNFNCIYPAPYSTSRDGTCGWTIKLEDRVQALALRDKIARLGPPDDSFNHDLRKYAKLCFCKRHRTDKNEAQVDMVWRQWAEELNCLYQEHCDTSKRMDKCTKLSMASPSILAKDTTPTRITVSLDHSQGHECTPSMQDSLPKPLHTIIPGNFEGIPSWPIDDQTLDGTPQVRAHHQTSGGVSTPEKYTQLLIGSPDENPQKIYSRRRSCRIASGLLQMQSRSTLDSNGFERYTPLDQKTMPEALRAKLTILELNPGFVYLFTRKSIPGFVKIGFTTNKSELRFQNQKPCAQDLEHRYSTVQIPNAKRMEGLIHSQLADCHFRYTLCKERTSCRRAHREWFKLDVEEALGIVQSWARWATNYLPYDTGDLGVEWSDLSLEFDECVKSLTGESILQTAATRGICPRAREVRLAQRDDSLLQTPLRGRGKTIRHYFSPVIKPDSTSSLGQKVPAAPGNLQKKLVQKTRRRPEANCSEGETHRQADSVNDQTGNLRSLVDDMVPDPLTYELQHNQGVHVHASLEDPFYTPPQLGRLEGLLFGRVDPETVILDGSTLLVGTQNPVAGNV